ncbi:MAG: TolC family protein, partial [Anaerolineales bacterium]|nr:TolC family protein [Anaerolineales bacterium]
ALAESELIRTRLAVAELQAEADRTRALLDKLAGELSLYLGASVPVESLPTDLPEYTKAEVIQQTWDQFDNAPVIRQQQIQLAHLRAGKRLADVPLVTALSVTAGLKILPEFNQQVPVVGFSLESPLFSKRKTRIQAKEFEIQAGLDEFEYLKSELNLQRQQWRAAWRISKSQLATLQDALIPEASMLHDKVSQEYRAGARQYLDVLDTQNLLTDLQAQALELQVEMAAQLFEMNLTLGVMIYEFE